MSALRKGLKVCLRALDRSILRPHPWLPSISRGFLLSGPPVASQLCKHHINLPSLPLRCPCITLGRRCANQHPPKEDFTSLLQCGRH